MAYMVRLEGKPGVHLVDTDGPCFCGALHQSFDVDGPDRPAGWWVATVTVVPKEG